MNKHLLRSGCARVTASGIVFKGARFTCSKAIRDQWFEKAAFENEWRVRNLSQVIRQEIKKIRRGVELSDGFNSILSEVKKEKKEIYKDEVIRNLILPAAFWYEGIHMIRTEETHYGMGQVVYDEGVFKYQNQNRRGEPPTIIFEFRNASSIFDSFISYIKHVENNLIFLNKAI